MPRVGGPVRVLIGGGSGFIGSALTAALRGRGDGVTWISRTPGPGRVTWDDLARDGLPPCDAVVSLAGMHILNPRRRWNDAYGEEVISSRVETTRTLVRCTNESPAPPAVFVSTAGKCFYGTRELDAAEAHGIVDNATFTAAFARRLRRPVVWSVPEWLVRRLVGDERSSILLRGQNVRPWRTLEAGYAFRYPRSTAPWPTWCGSRSEPGRCPRLGTRRLGSALPLADAWLVASL